MGAACWCRSTVGVCLSARVNPTLPQVSFPRSADGKRMAEAFLRLYSDSTRIDQMRRKAYHYTQGLLVVLAILRLHLGGACVSAEFRWSLIAQKYLELIKVVVRANPAAS